LIVVGLLACVSVADIEITTVQVARAKKARKSSAATASGVAAAHVSHGGSRLVAETRTSSDFDQRKWFHSVASACIDVLKELDLYSDDGALEAIAGTGTVSPEILSSSTTSSNGGIASDKKRVALRQKLMATFINISFELAFHGQTSVGNKSCSIWSATREGLRLLIHVNAIETLQAMGKGINDSDVLAVVAGEPTSIVDDADSVPVVALASADGPVNMADEGDSCCEEMTCLNLRNLISFSLTDCPSFPLPSEADVDNKMLPILERQAANFNMATIRPLLAAIEHELYCMAFNAEAMEAYAKLRVDVSNSRQTTVTSTKNIGDIFLPFAGSVSLQRRADSMALLVTCFLRISSLGFGRFQVKFHFIEYRWIRCAQFTSTL
jgi:hypothetical protein